MRKLLTALLPIAVAVSAGPAFAAFESLTTSGKPVLKLCQGVEDDRNPVADVCRVQGSFPSGSGGTFPGQPGTDWALFSSNNGQAVIANGSQVGTLDDRVWRRGSSTSYVYGVRLSLANQQWTPPAGCADTTPDFFEINDIFRTGFKNVSPSVAYRLDGNDEGIWLAGRTNQGLNQYATSPEGLNPKRDNNFVDFRTDINYEDPDGTSVVNSAWLFIAVTSATPPKTRTTANTITLRQGGEEGQCQFSLPLNGFKP